MAKKISQVLREPKVTSRDNFKDLHHSEHCKSLREGSDNGITKLDI